MISFLSPLFLLGALAAAVPIVLHLIKRQPETRVKFAAVRLLRHAPVEDMQKRHLRELLLLALRVAALLLLAFAFARPFLTTGAAAAPSGITVVALDTSLSLSAAGQFDRARQLAKAAIDRAPAGDVVGVVTFADSARRIAAPSGDRALARAAVDTAATSFGSTHYRAALNAATEMIGNVSAARATIVVVTDLQRADGMPATGRQFPTRRRSKSLMSVRRRRIWPSRRCGPTATASWRRFATPVHSRVRRVRSSPSMAGGSRRVRLSWRRTSLLEVTLAGARGVTAAVSVTDPQGIQGDNVRYVVLNNAGRPSVLVVTTNGDLARDAFYLQQALLAAGAESAAYQVEGVGAAKLSGWDRARLTVTPLLFWSRLSVSSGVDAICSPPFSRQAAGF